MATKAPLAALYAENDEEQKLVDEIKDTYSKLRGALENRTQLFDPVLLAMAQGFLAPTKTGSFGESLSNVASLVGPAQEAENKRAMQAAQMRLELAQSELGMRQAAKGEQEFKRLLGIGPTPQAPSAARPAEAPQEEFVEPEGGGMRVLRSELPGAKPAEKPAEPGTEPTAQAAALAGTPPPGQQAANAPAGFSNITPQAIAALAARPGMEGRAKILADMVKMEQDRFAMSMNGIVFDKRTQRYLDIDIPGQKQEPFETPEGKQYFMTPNEYAQMMNAYRQGKGAEWMKNNMGNRRTVQDIAAAGKAAETAATKTAEAQVGRTQSAIDAAQDYAGRMVSYQTLKTIAGGKDAKEIFGIFQRPDFGSFIANLIQENLKTPGAGNTISVPAIEGAMRNLGLPQDQIDKYQLALSVMATIQLQQSKLMAGQGAVSNFERQLFADASISPRDNPQTIIKKVSLLEERAKFDRQVARELTRTKMSLDDYKDKYEDKYDEMVRSYLDRAANIVAGIRAPAAKPAAPRPAGSAPYSKSREELRKELGF